ncbi:MAG TPA: hypothetical protein VFB28_03415 [Terriglobales bacterium]|nr:hypothetical protein [Terriglobales bacterium]
MKYPKYLMIIGLFALLLPASVFAKTKKEGTMKLEEPAKIGSTLLQPGTYDVAWEGSGQNVRVNIMRHNNTVASASGELKTNDAAASQDAVVLKPTSDGQKQVSEIDFGKHQEAVVISPNDMNGGQ